MSNETPERDRSEPGYKSIKPEPPYFWTAILRPTLLVFITVCSIFFAACFVATQGKFGVKDAEKLSDIEINLWPRAGEETKVEIYSTFERTLWGKKEILAARVPISRVRYEVDPSVEEVAVSVVPTFWSRLSDPVIYFDGSEATIYVPNEEEVLLVKEFLAQDKTLSYAGFRWFKDAEKKSEEWSKDIELFIRQFRYNLGEQIVQIARDNGYSEQEACNFLLETSTNIKNHERVHGNDWSTTLVFDDVERNCQELVDEYKQGAK